MLALCEDEGVVGRAFYVMEMLDGEVHWDPRLKEHQPAQRAAIFDAMNATIAQIARRFVSGGRLDAGALNRVEAGVRAFTIPKEERYTIYVSGDA